MNNNQGQNQNQELKEQQFISTSDAVAWVDRLRAENPVYAQVLIGKLVSGQFLVIPDELANENDYAGYEEWADELDNNQEPILPNELDLN